MGLQPHVEISCGRLRGRRECDVWVFRGIPFAQPPCGALRFQAPRRPEPWALWAAIKADHVVRHPSMRLAEGHARVQPQTYAYLFTWASPFMGGMLGACHILDVPFVFGTLCHPHSAMFTGDGPDADGYRRSLRMSPMRSVKPVRSK